MVLTWYSVGMKENTTTQWTMNLAKEAFEQGKDIPAKWETVYDDGADGCVPVGWYLIGVDKNGFSITFPVRHEYGPFKSKQQALDFIPKQLAINKT
jgi:hypothetical protein